VRVIRERLPNLITNGRLVLALVFFFLLSKEPLEAHTLNIAFVIFVVAGLSDILDGYLARRFNVTSSFGRVADPFVDKILICGAFIILLASDTFDFIRTWMVLVIVGRELLVTAVRSFAESQKKMFAASALGKVKMFLQSFAIGYAIFIYANWRDVTWWDNAKLIAVILAYAATLATLASGVVYIFAFRAFYREGMDNE